MSQTLNDKLSAAADMGLLKKDIPDHIIDNLAPHIVLRPYQVTALERFLFFVEDYPQKPSNRHLLFHMATGSGKTVLMAALMLDLYARGYRNFLFFVNSSQIIEKTRENFLNPASSKYLFAPQPRIEDKPIEIRSVTNFEAVSSDAINIHFTTIQGLHTRMNEPRENAVTMEDFRQFKVVMISDEAHHLNAETKKTLTKGEAEDKNSWESTIDGIFAKHMDNILLDFSATVDLSHKAIRAKYHDKILYDYSLRQFREDGYSKDIELRQADLPPVDRMMQAVVISQYRRKVAEAHGLHCKPVILMKSRYVKPSTKGDASYSMENQKAFHDLISGLTGERLEALRASSASDDTLMQAFDFIMDDHGMTPDEFARELQGDFSPEKVVNVNDPKDLEKRQIELNALEDRSNEIRVIFAVDKLNEGWDVLNLFDIVRLYDTRDGKDNKVGNTTMAEAQLIGRGARYFPFISPDQPVAAREKRKYDSAVEHPLRILEQLHYHCSHNPKYIQDIRNALRETGMLDDTTRTVKLRLKESFKKSDLYQNGLVWMNSRIKNLRGDVFGFDDYHIEQRFNYPTLMTGRVTETSAFGSKSTQKLLGKEPVSRDFNLADFGRSILSFAMDANNFFHFESLKNYFPHLLSTSQFLTSDIYLGGVTVAVRGLPEELNALTSGQKLDITQFVLCQIESGVKRENVEFIGTKDFKPYRIKDCFTDKTLKLRIEGETGLSWAKGESNVPGLDQIDLASKDWHAYDDSYGTDQEKHFIKYLNDQAEQLRKLYDDFHLLRNEKALKLFSFKNGQAFEPDFVLFLRRAVDGAETVMQLFIEPKGSHLTNQDQWKEDFLKQLKSDAKLQVLFQGSDYKILGLPFFNDSSPMINDFRESFNSTVGINGKTKSPMQSD